MVEINPMQFKSLHFTNAWHEDSGGIRTFYRALLQAANRRQQWLRLVVPSARTWSEDIGAFGRIYHVKARRAPFNTRYRVLDPTSYLAPGSQIKAILEEERPDLVEISDKYTLNYLGGLLRVWRGRRSPRRPTVVGLSCERMDDNVMAYLPPTRIGRHFARWYMKWLYFPLFDHHIANSRHTAAELAEAGRGHIRRRGVWLGPMGVDYELFSSGQRDENCRRAWESACGAGAGATLLLYAGRLDREKNCGLLIDTIEALQRHGDYRLIIAGSGEQEETLRRDAAAKAPGRVHFAGQFGDRSKLASLYHCADAFVHPNPREPFGIAPLEAMAAGLPLVAPPSGGLLTYANEQNAWLAPPEPEAFAAAVRTLMQNPPERQRRIEAARRTAASYSWTKATDLYLDLYAELHALTQGACAAPAIPPLFYSTPGDAWGREIHHGNGHG